MIRRGPSGDQPPMLSSPHHDFPANFRLHKTSFPRATAEVGTPLFIGAMETWGIILSLPYTMWTELLVLALALFPTLPFAQGQNEQVSLSSCAPTYFQLSDSPYENYFVSTCNFAATVVGLSPAPDSNLTLISPRLIAAFPAGMPRCSEETLTI